MAIDSSGSGSGTISLLRDTITALRGADTINRINPTPNDPDRISTQDSVQVSQPAPTDPRVVEQQELDTIRQGLSEANAAGNVALAGAQSVSDTLDEIGARLVELTDENLADDRRATLAAEIEELVGQGLEAVDQASFNGVNLLDDQRDSDLQVTADREGATETVRDQDIRPALQNLQELAASTPEGAQAALNTVFAEARQTTDTAVRQLTEDTGRIGERIAGIQDRQAELAATDETVDTDLDADGAQQTAQDAAVQLQQALDGQILGVVNQRPETLVGLFR